MCDKQREESAKVPYRDRDAGQMSTRRPESHMLYELKQKREYLYSQLSLVQRAIEAVNLADNF